MINTKSVHSEIDRANDGLRILATRLRGRGLPRNRYDVWMANLGPSEHLLRRFLRRTISWKRFSQAYRKELFDSAAFDRRNLTIRNHGQKFTLRLIQELARHQNVTLLCHCAEDEEHCHRHLLKAILDRAI